MLAGQRPFWSSNTSDIYQNIQAGRYKKLPENLSPQVSHLLSILLSTDPLKRATMLDVLNHPWMKNYPVRAQRSDSSPFLFSPQILRNSPTVKRQPHPLLLARKFKGVSCEQLDVSAIANINKRVASQSASTVDQDNNHSNHSTCSHNHHCSHGHSHHNTNHDNDNNSDNNSNDTDELQPLMVVGEEKASCMQVHLGSQDLVVTERLGSILKHISSGLTVCTRGDICAEQSQAARAEY